MSGQFIQRLINYLANEVFIKGLAQSKTFQRFAVRTDATLRDVHKVSTETMHQTLASYMEQQQAAGGGAMPRGPPPKPLTGFPGFVSSFFKEIRKDFAGSK